METVTFFIINLIVILSAFFITSRLLRITDTVDFFITFSLLYFSQIVITTLLLGIIGKLFLFNLILLNASILLATYSCLRSSKDSINLLHLPKRTDAFLKNKILLFGTSLLIGFALIKLCVNLVNPPAGWDCLNYHFNFPVEWLKTGRLDILTTIADDPSPPYYPINGSLLFLWLIVPFKNVFMADLGQVPFFLLGFLAIFNCCQKLGLKKELSFYAAGLFIITPNILKQIEIAYVDIMLVSLFMVCLNFLISLYHKFSLRDIFLFALSFGLFLGTKTSAVVYGVLLFVFLLVVLIRARREAPIKNIYLGILIVCSTVLVLGGFTYIRNFILTGNMLYPAEIKIFGKVLFKGVMPFATYRDKWTGHDYNFEKLLFNEGLGGQFIIFVLPAALIAPIFLFLKRKTQINALTLYVASLPILLYCAFYFLMPQLWVRYLYPFLAAGFICAMWLAKLMNIPRKIITFLACICFIASAGELSGHMELVSSLIVSGLCFFMFPFFVRRIKFKPAILLILLAFFMLGLHFMNQKYNREEFSRYLNKSRFPKEEREAWFWLDKNIKGAKIAYTGSPDALPLYGTNFKNDALYVSVNSTQPAKLHFFPKARYVWKGDFIELHKDLEKKGNYRENPDYATWLKNLRLEEIDYLLVYAYHQVADSIFPIENNWAAAHSERFEEVFSNKRIHLYRLLN